MLRRTEPWRSRVPRTATGDVWRVRAASRVVLSEPRGGFIYSTQGILYTEIERAPVSSRAPADPTVAVPQIPVDDLDVATNVDRVRRRTAALPDRVDVAVFPEYALTGFADDDRLGEVALARPDATERLEAIAADTGVAVVAGYAERGDDATYNAVAYVPSPDGADGDAREPTGEAVAYRKRHLWGDERGRIAPGHDRVVAETPVGTTGLMTCYDLNFVEESAWFAERAVDALFVPGAWPADHAANWRLLVRARALDGGRWVVAAGRTGTAGGARDPNEVRYAGRSLVARPDGAVAAELGRDPDTLVATLDRETLSAQRDLVGVIEE